MLVWETATDGVQVAPLWIMIRMVIWIFMLLIILIMILSKMANGMIRTGGGFIAIHGSMKGSRIPFTENRGDGTFTDVTQRAGVYNDTGKGLGVTCGDYDNDGRIDIYVANDTTPNFLYHNMEMGLLWISVLLPGSRITRMEFAGRRDGGRFWGL